MTMISAQPNLQKMDFFPRNFTWKWVQATFMPSEDIRSSLEPRIEWREPTL